MNMRPLALRRHPTLLPSLAFAALLGHLATSGNPATAADLSAGTPSTVDVAVTVQVDQPGAPINPAMWGVFFEDINGGADGGLYAELVRNRSFEFSDPLMGWKVTSPSRNYRVGDERPIHAANPHFLRLELATGASTVTLENDGFAGMGVRRDAWYTFSLFARSTGAALKKVRAELVSSKGRSMCSDTLSGFPGNWSKHEISLRPNATDAHAKLVLHIEGTGILDLDMVSLFPTRTWMNRPGGLRADLVQMLADLKPGFVRFPGGCIVEGRNLGLRYQWKTTVGPVEQRKSIINRWNDEFKHRPAPDYFQTFGLGFYEYFQMCDDIGAQPLPILNCGMACQFNTGELVPLDQLDPYVEDALDLIEFANGPVTSPWGAVRASMGHPEAFNLRLLGVGNEQWGPQYIERYAVFAKAIKTKYPDIQLVSSAGPGPNDERFHFLWPKLRELGADIVDEHCYDVPAWFLDNSRRYDDRPRTGPKVFFGEYAAQSVKTVSPENRNTWGCALAEAAYMTGLERNAEVVTMASYAPLFAHEERWQWRPNLIWFDNLRVYGTPNYYVQQLFSRNRGDRVLPTRLGAVPQAANGQPRFYASAVRDALASEIVLKLVNASEGPVNADIDLANAGKVASKARATLLTSPRLADENSIAAPMKVAPASWSIPAGPSIRHFCPPYSVVVLRVATKRGQ